MRERERKVNCLLGKIIPLCGITACILNPKRLFPLQVILGSKSFLVFDTNILQHCSSSKWEGVPLVRLKEAGRPKIFRSVAPFLILLGRPYKRWRSIFCENLNEKVQVKI